MGLRNANGASWALLFVFVAILSRPVSAFGAGNIASISRIEGINWRHGDIEDMLKTIAFLGGRKWTSMLVKRVYFGNWLRDYSQAMDVGSLKSVPAESVRVLVWILSFLSFGYATGEFEVTAERLGVYRPEEHIDNPKDYADNQDARQYDSRLRPPVQPLELEIDPRTGMKNYIANDGIGIANSFGYVKHSLLRSIHFGRIYTHGQEQRGNESDLCEALRCLGQALHCMEDFGAHTNYCEVALRELGYLNVFPHTGADSEITLPNGNRVYPLVTGTFGMVDFIHSVLGEATDHFTQSEVDELDKTLATAQGNESAQQNTDQLSHLTHLLSQVPGAGGLAREAERLHNQSAEQERLNNMSTEGVTTAPQNDSNIMDSQPTAAIPGMKPNFDPVATAKKIYPILEFRDKIAKAIASTIEKVPGLEALVEKVTETVTLFILSLLAPFVRPIIEAVPKSLKQGSSGVIDASGKHQYEPWTDPKCTDPTHSMLSKDHFANILNEVAGQVATVVLQYVAPRVLYAAEHPEVPVEQVIMDVGRVFHHPAMRDHNCELHMKMFETVQRWAQNTRHNIDDLLSSESVRRGRNQLEIGDQHDTTHHLGAMGGGQGPGSLQMPSTSTLGDIFSKAASNRFGSSAMGAVSRLGKASGLSREAEELNLEAEAAQITSEYPGTDVAYDQRRSPSGPSQGPTGVTAPQPPWPTQGYYGYGQPPAPGEYEGGYMGTAPPSHGQYNHPGVPDQPQYPPY